MSDRRKSTAAGRGKAGQRRATQLAVRQRKRRRTRAGRRGIPKLWVFGPTALFFLGLVVIGAGAGAAYGVYQSFANDLIEPTDIELTQRSLGTSKVFDRDGEDGELLFEFADPLSGLRNPIQIETVSHHLIDATVSTEDATFFDNTGINTRGLLRAAWENVGLGFGSGDFLGGSGGSSITQQLVKNVLLPAEERTERTVSRFRLDGRRDGGLGRCQAACHGPCDSLRQRRLRGMPRLRASEGRGDVSHARSC